MSDLISRNEALKVSEKPTGSDLINRRDAIDALQNEYCAYCEQERTIRKLLESLPSAEQKGKWMNHYCDEDGYIDGIECSCCHEWWYMGGNLPNFCPNCGARMVNEDAKQL